MPVCLLSIVVVSVLKIGYTIQEKGAPDLWGLLRHILEKDMMGGRFLTDLRFSNASSLKCIWTSTMSYIWHSVRFRVNVKNYQQYISRIEKRLLADLVREFPDVDIDKEDIYGMYWMVSMSWRKRPSSYLWWMNGSISFTGILCRTAIRGNILFFK